MIQQKIQALFPNMEVTTEINTNRIVVETAQTEIFYYNAAHHIMRLNSIDIDTALKIKDMYLETLSEPLTDPNKHLLD